MIYSLNKNNFSVLNNTFIDRKEIENELLNNPFGKVLLYEEDKQIIGYIYYSDIYDRAEINQFEIDLIHRNCGKGKELLKKLIETVDKDITLEVRIDNYPAIKVYKDNGFEQTAIRKGYYKGIDGLLMERKKDSE